MMFFFSVNCSYSEDELNKVKEFLRILSGLIRNNHVKNEKYAGDERTMKFGFTIKQRRLVGGPVMLV